MNGVAIAIFVIEDESVSGWKFTLPILIAVTGSIAMPQEKAQTVTGNTVLKASDLSGVEVPDVLRLLPWYRWQRFRTRRGGAENGASGSDAARQT